MRDILDQLHSEMIQCGIDAGLDHEAAKRMADRWRESVQLQYRTDVIYIPARTSEQRKERRAVIRAEFDGTPGSRDRLCQRLGISRSTFYRLLGK